MSSTASDPARAETLATGSEDRICPPAVNIANFKRQHDAPAATEHQGICGPLPLPGADGWEEVADFVLSWASKHANRAA